MQNAAPVWSGAEESEGGKEHETGKRERRGVLSLRPRRHGGPAGLPNAADRKKCERYGLKVRLCHGRCHIFGPEAAHNCAETMRTLRRYGQRKAMIEQGWTVDEFRFHFGKNYLDDEELAEIAAIQAESA